MVSVGAILLRLVVVFGLGCSLAASSAPSDGSVAYLQWNSSSTIPLCDNCPPGHFTQLNTAVCSNDSYFWQSGVLHQFKDPIPAGHKLLRVRLLLLVSPGLTRLFRSALFIGVVLFAKETPLVLQLFWRAKRSPTQRSLPQAALALVVLAPTVSTDGNIRRETLDRTARTLTITTTCSLRATLLQARCA